jgi:hypothetical protein
MDLQDADLVRLLVERDGGLRPGWSRHGKPGECGFQEFYPNGDCPWCAARQRREASGPAAG